MFEHIKVGDVVTRDFCGLQKWPVIAVDDKYITIGMGWVFDRKTGREYDPDVPSISGMSRLIREVKVMNIIRIIGNKPLTSDGKDEQYPEQTIESAQPLQYLVNNYIAEHGICSSVMITVVYPEHVK